MKVTLNYQQLVNEIDAAIRAGKMSFLDGVDKRKAHIYRNYQPHPQLPALETAQSRLGERYGYTPSLLRQDFGVRLRR
jgi:hypothetical protein